MWWGFSISWKIINANYVDNVVVRLYTSLCDNAEKLYQAIVKIKD